VPKGPAGAEGLGMTLRFEEEKGGTLLLVRDEGWGARTGWRIRRRLSSDAPLQMAAALNLSFLHMARGGEETSLGEVERRSDTMGLKKEKGLWEKGFPRGEV